MADIIQQRRDTAARWAQYNPILLEGEVGYVTDNPNQYKIGNGRDKWNDLPLRGYTGTITQDTGDDENAVMSQKAVTDKLSELGSDFNTITGIDKILTFSERGQQKIGDINIPAGKKFVISVSSEDIDFTRCIVTYNDYDNGSNRVKDYILNGDSYKVTAPVDIHSLYLYLVTATSYVGVINVIISGDLFDLEQKIDITKELLSDDIGRSVPIALGKNLFTQSRVTSGKYLYSGGELLDNSSFNVTCPIPVNPQTEYHLSKEGDDVVGDGGYLCFYDKDFGFISSIKNSRSSKTFTSPSNATFVRCSYKISDVNVQLEKGNKRTSFEQPNEIEGYVDALKGKIVSFFENSSFSKNLFDKDSVKIARDKYLFSAGEEFGNANFCVSEYIRVYPNMSYHLSSAGDGEVSSSGAYLCFYDKDFKFVSSLAGDTKNFVTPENAEYVRFSYYKDLSESIILEFGTFRGEYSPYNRVAGYTIERSKSSLKGYKYNLLGGESLSLDNMPEGLRFGNSFSAFFSIPNGIGNGIRIGWGYGVTGGTYIVIDSTNVTVYHGAKDNPAQQDQKTHTLNLLSYMKVVGRVDDNMNLHINISTFGGNYKGELHLGNAGFNGDFHIATLSEEIINVRIAVANSTLSKDIWTFGDSYFATEDNTRVGYYLKEMNLTQNMMLQAYGGQSPGGAYVELLKALAFHTPKTIVWAVGMNGPFESVCKPTIENLKILCEQRNIKLILCTIPVPLSDNSWYDGKQELTEYVRASGYDFIDTYAAVGSDSNGNWYGSGTAYDYQSRDQVHPSAYGAKAIAEQWCVDFPEIMGNSHG